MKDRLRKRTGSVERNTKETKIFLGLDLDGSGLFEGKSGIGFFDHMLELFAKHSQFGLKLECRGDLAVDGHHTVEDIGLCLGQAFREALGDRRGITRYASCALPMDESLILCAVDISGRSGFFSTLSFPTMRTGDFDNQLVNEFWQAFVNEARVTLHFKQLSGVNSHHLAEAVFKGAARCLKEAAKIVGEEIPSTKGVL